MSGRLLREEMEVRGIGRLGLVGSQRDDASPAPERRDWRDAVAGLKGFQMVGRKTKVYVAKSHELSFSCLYVVPFLAE